MVLICKLNLFVCVLSYFPSCAWSPLLVYCTEVTFCVVLFCLSCPVIFVPCLGFLSCTLWCCSLFEFFTEVAGIRFRHEVGKLLRLSRCSPPQVDHLVRSAPLASSMDKRACQQQGTALRGAWLFTLNTENSKLSQNHS